MALPKVIGYQKAEQEFNYLEIDTDTTPIEMIFLVSQERFNHEPHYFFTLRNQNWIGDEKSEEAIASGGSSIDSGIEIMFSSASGRIVSLEIPVYYFFDGRTSSENDAVFFNRENINGAIFDKSIWSEGCAVFQCYRAAKSEVFSFMGNGFIRFWWSHQPLVWATVAKRLSIGLNKENELRGLEIYFGDDVFSKKIISIGRKRGWANG